jgi:hypothetical protein
VCLLLGFTFLAFKWGNLHLTMDQKRYRQGTPDKAKLAAFLLLGLAWTCKLSGRMIWDYVNLAFVAYIEEKSLWGKQAYSWY